MGQGQGLRDGGERWRVIKGGMKRYREGGGGQEGWGRWGSREREGEEGLGLRQHAIVSCAQHGAVE